MLRGSQSIDKIIDLFAKTSKTVKMKYTFGAWIALDENVCVRTERYLYVMGCRSLDKQVVYVFGARGRLRRRVSSYGWSVLAIYSSPSETHT